MAGPLVRSTRFGARSLSVIAAGVTTIALSAQAPPNPPVARKVPKTTTIHGVTLTDNYSWLRQKDSPAVKAYLDAENAYTEAGTRHLATLRDTLYKEMLGRIKESDEQVPVWENGYWYYTRTEKGKA
jgi:oligopeptidase B